MLEIKEYTLSDKDEVIELILHCQNDGTRPLVTIDDQPELLYIIDKYIVPGGRFWVAKDCGKIVGTIGIMNKGGGLGILKKFFVHETYRGKPYNLGQKLYNTLLDFAYKHNFNQLILDTPSNTERAHKFYLKAGFKRLNKDELPVVYDYPYDDAHFFILNL